MLPPPYIPHAAAAFVVLTAVVARQSVGFPSVTMFPASNVKLIVTPVLHPRPG